MLVLDCGCYRSHFGLWEYECEEGRRLNEEQRLAARARDRLMAAEYEDADEGDVLDEEGDAARPDVEPSAELVAAGEAAAAAWRALRAHVGEGQRGGEEV